MTIEPVPSASHLQVSMLVGRYKLVDNNAKWSLLAVQKFEVVFV